MITCDKIFNLENHEIDQINTLNDYTYTWQNFIIAIK